MNMTIVEEMPIRSALNVDLTALCARRAVPLCTRYFRWKGNFDRVLAACLLIPGVPLLVFLILLVRCTSRGPGIYRQTRVGKGGKLFTMYKLRTMRNDAETKSGPVWTQVNDPRITWLGWILRKVHLDELPQLFNVLLGDMSLVGPRPERPEFVLVLSQQIPNYTDRLAVLPGVTGLAQINLPPDTDLNSVRRKQYLDMEYVHTAGIWLDIRMMLCTSLRLIGLSGAKAMRLTGVVRNVPDEICNTAEDNASPSRPSMTPWRLGSPELRAKLASIDQAVCEQDGELRDQISRLLVGDHSNHGRSDHHGDHGEVNGRRHVSNVVNKPR